MELNKTYSFLKRVKYMDIKIKKLKLRRDELMSCLMPAAVRYDVDRVQATPNDQMSMLMAQIAEIDREMSELIYERADTIKAISEATDKLDDENAKFAIEAYYIAKKPMRWIAKEIHYSERGAYKLFKRGIAEISKTLKK